MNVKFFRSPCLLVFCIFCTGIDIVQAIENAQAALTITTSNNVTNPYELSVICLIGDIDFFISAPIQIPNLSYLDWLIAALCLLNLQQWHFLKGNF